MDKAKIEEIIRRWAGRGMISDEKVEPIVNELIKMKDIKEVSDYLALRVEKHFGKEGQKLNFDACIQDILELSGGAYNNVDEIINQIQINNAKNYTPRKYISRRKS